jgi:CheY-like chemotaxis protein
MDDIKYHFLIVDDSKLDCFVAEKVIKNSGKAVTIKSFLEPLKALDYIKGYSDFDSLKTILILDIQMPVMTGHQFIEAFEKLSQEIQNRYIIYMISSSSNESDINRIANYRSVRKFSNKFINKEMIDGFLKDLY